MKVCQRISISRGSQRVRFLLCRNVSCPTVSLVSGAKHYHFYNQFVLRVERRDALLAHLKQKGIGAEIYYPVPFHLQECFRYLGHKSGDFAESERAAKGTVAIPIWRASSKREKERRPLE